MHFTTFKLSNIELSDIYQANNRINTNGFVCFSYWKAFSKSFVEIPQQGLKKGITICESGH